MTAGNSLASSYLPPSSAGLLYNYGFRDGSSYSTLPKATVSERWPLPLGSVSSPQRTPVPLSERTDP